MHRLIDALVLAMVVLLAALVVVRLRAEARRKARRARHRQSGPARVPRDERAPEADEDRATASDHERWLPRLAFEEDEELDITKLTLTPEADEPSDSAEGETKRFERGVIPIIYDDDAAMDEPTQAHAHILVSAGGQSDTGIKRKQNEDRLLMMEGLQLYVVADGMGGHAGGAVASGLATEEMEDAFRNPQFDERQYAGVPRRGRELVQAIQRANRRIYDEALAKPELTGMGTTIICARFSPNKQRVYIGHVGDSRCYLLRDDELRQISSDHTAGAQGYKGRQSAHLTRALGVKKTAIVDLILGKPRPGDRYILCSDGLPKMVADDRIRELLLEHPHPSDAVPALIEATNRAGGKDNTTIVVIRIDDFRQN